MKYLNEIKILRAKFPVGARQAGKLLAESGGDVDLAGVKFKEGQINILMQKESLTAEQATQFLEAASYDIEIAIQRSEAVKHSTTELCLLRNKDKEDAINKVLHAINEKYHHDFWLCWQKECPETHAVEYPFVVLLEWINYESWEGDIVLSPVVARACCRLGIQWLENMLHTTINRSNEVEKIWEDETYILLNKSFQERRSELIDVLYGYVKENIIIFP